MTPKLFVAVVLVGTVATALAAETAAPLVYNGSFRQATDGVPDGWQTAGRRDIVQTLSVQSDPERGTVARLDCAHFVPGSPDSHAMLAQVGKVGVTKGQWYRLSMWMRSEGMEGGAVSVALSDTRVWSDVGLNRSFPVDARWRQFEATFQATRDLPASAGRLQIWFGRTGTLYVSDVTLEPTTELRREWQPQLPLDGVTNAIPNSSFECGGAGWGCWTGQGASWGTSLFHRVGEWDTTRGWHGRSSWKLTIPPKPPLTLYFDYYDPAAQPVTSVLLGHEGWVPVERGKSYTFSACVMGDRPGTPVRIVIQEEDDRRQTETFSAGTDWARVVFTFDAQRDFACGFVGLDGPGTLWVDAVQFEVGRRATPYQPRRGLEAFVETDAPGNIFTDPARGAVFHLRAYNDAEQERTLRGTMEVTDFRGATIVRRTGITVVPAKSAVSDDGPIGGGPLGFFRLRWRADGVPPQDLRYAVIRPAPAGDSVFGMNHAFGDGFLLPLAHAAGLAWWRDWSAQWRLVQPKPDAEFDFSVPDAQIDRVLDAGGLVDVLLPFPSAPWASAPDEALMRKAAGDRPWELTRMPTAFKPKDLGRWADYVRATVAHYAPRTQTFEILNEPIYTGYALPRAFGYDLPDYLDMLRSAYGAAKQADPGCTVVGGIAAGPSSDLCRRFIAEGGTQWCDVMNYHMYPSVGWAEGVEPALQERLGEMKARGEVRPVWMTEFGIYGEDDPARTPFAVGDTTMTNAMRPSELDAAADLVRYAAVFCANGVRKVFYHAGTCAALNQSSAGNMFFEYGGAPRVQYAALAALSGLIGPDFEFVRKWTEPAWLTAYEFRSWGRTVVIAWTRADKPQTLDLPEGFSAVDLMGNPRGGGRIPVDDVPLYFVSP